MTGGRPKKYKDPAARQKAFRAKQAERDKHYIAGYISGRAMQCLDAMAKGWGCQSRAAAIERLILEAGDTDERTETAETAGAPGRRKSTHIL